MKAVCVVRGVLTVVLLQALGTQLVALGSRVHQRHTFGPAVSAACQAVPAFGLLASLSCILYLEPPLLPAPLQLAVQLATVRPACGHSSPDLLHHSDSTGAAE